MNGFDLSEAVSITMGSDEILALYYGSNLIWPTTKYEQEYFTITSRKDNNSVYFITMSTVHGDTGHKTIQVSKDKQTWTSYTSTTNTETHPSNYWYEPGDGTLIGTLDQGESLYIKGTNDTYGGFSYLPSSGTYYATNWNCFYCLDDFDVSGNIMSLLYGDNFQSATSLPTPPSAASSAFAKLFCTTTTHNNSQSSIESKLINAQNLVLPEVTLQEWCCLQMFEDCVNLKTAPRLKPMTLATRCYTSMFRYCSSLRMTPVLPATTLTDSCYYEMFKYCTSLGRVNSIEATTVSTKSCNNMFYGCNSLFAIPPLKAKNGGVSNSYDYMFGFCSSLDNIEILSQVRDLSPSNWVVEVASYGTFKKPSTTTLPLNSIHGIPRNWTVTDIEGYHAINLNTTTNGTITTVYSGALSGDEIEVISTPDTNYRLGTLTVLANGDPITVTNNKFIMPASAVTVYATFVQDVFTITVNQPSQLGTISADKAIAHEGDTVTLTESPDRGCEFVQWRVRCNGSAVTVTNNQFTMPAGNVTVTADFDYINYTITTIIDGVGTVTVNPVAHYYDTVSLTLTPGTYEELWGYSVEYSGGAIPVYNNQFIMPDSNVTIYAYFTNYINEYLTFSTTESNAVLRFYEKVNDNDPITISYSTNGGNTWNTITSSTTGGNGIGFGANDKILVKGTNSAYARSDSNYTYFKTDNNAPFQVSGNIMSLIYGDNFANQTTLTSSYTFTGMFFNAYLYDASHLVMPATTLAPSCYRLMFRGTHLYYSNSVPKLLATTLAERCYLAMFAGSTLSEVPVDMLPATTLANSCYANMFQSCTSLTNAPVLPATTLNEDVYYEMFMSCRSLTTIPNNMLPATNLTGAYRCYKDMFKGCSALTTAPALPATTLYQDCYRAMFANCTLLATAPALPATTLATYCYYYMFQNCTSLTTAPTLPATTLTDYCYGYMFTGCSNLSSINCSATDISAASCTTNWVRNVAASGTFTKASSTTWSSGASGIPSGWTVVDAS